MLTASLPLIVRSSVPSCDAWPAPRLNTNGVPSLTFNLTIVQNPLSGVAAHTQQSEYGLFRRITADVDELRTTSTYIVQIDGHVRDRVIRKAVCVVVAIRSRVATSCTPNGSRVRHHRCGRR